MPLSAGSRLGPYEILSPVGTGGMGEVYRARDGRLDRDVAVKVLPSHLADDPVALARFEREAKAVAATSHPNILAIFDFGLADGIAFAVTELLDGETLRARLVGGPIPARKAIEYAVQIAEGLGAAHEKGIVHRDLKPENLFLTKDGRIKILDFGLARFVIVPGAEDTSSPTLSHHTEPGTLMGTMGYMSPEQVRGKPADHRSDIFSFGAVLYEMLTGRRAFKGETAADTLTAILTKDPPELSRPNGTRHPTLERIARRCLEKEPGERFHSAHDLGFALETLAEPTRDATPLPEASLQRRRWLLAVAAGLVIVIGGVLGLGAGKALWQRPLPIFKQLTFRRGTVSSARFTPDGQTIVYSAAWGGGLPEVFTTRPDTVESRPLGLANTTLVATALGEMAVVQHTVHPFQGTLAKTSLAGGVPREVAQWVWYADWTPDGTQFAVVLWREGRSRLEFPIGRLLYEGGPTWIRNPRISPRRDQVAFIGQSSGAASIVVVDLSAKNQILSTGWNSAEGLAWSPNGKEIWFTASKDGAGRALHAVTLSGQERVIARMTGTLTLHDIFRDGRVLLTQTRSRGEVWGLPPSETRERDFSWLDETAVKDLSDDGKSFVFVDRGSVYLRHTDGSPPVRLCEGADASLSPDGKWVISYLPTSPSQLTMLPTGAGEPRTLPAGTVYDHNGGWWFPDGKRILIVGREHGKGLRLFVQSLEQGPPRPITPEGSWPATDSTPISPDGTLVAVFTALPGRWTLRATDGSGEPDPIPGLPTPTDADVVRWSADGRYLFVRERAAGLPVRIQRLNLKTGNRESWKQLRPPDATGVEGDGVSVFLTPDGRSYLYSYRRDLSDLYLVDGLK